MLICWTSQVWRSQRQKNVQDQISSTFPHKSTAAQKPKQGWFWDGYKTVLMELPSRLVGYWYLCPVRGMAKAVYLFNRLLAVLNFSEEMHWRGTGAACGNQWAAGLGNQFAPLGAIGWRGCREAGNPEGAPA